ncbi:hypothetical protein [Nostoc sp. WHI]|nr:hypothetical protein [Nostoc sp. WHI]
MSNLDGNNGFAIAGSLSNKIIVTATDEVLVTLTGINPTTLIAANFTIV